MTPPSRKVPVTPSLTTVTVTVTVTGSCINIYNALVPQLYKAVVRYKADAYAIDALS